MRAVRICVRGRVQGVGFRAWTYQRARALGIQGWVRNQPDGSVEAWLEGETALVDTLLERLRSGPGLARVDALEIEERSPERSSSGFRIR